MTAPGNPRATTQTELLGRYWLSTQLTLQSIEVAHPDRDVEGVDLIAYPTDLSWVCPIQLKVVASNGVTIWSKYLDKPVAIVYVLLGSDQGGPAKRPTTQAFAMSPKDAWDLPRRCGRSYLPETHTTYRFESATENLRRELDSYAVSAAGWHSQLRALAAHK
jgi:hypothetical protein